VRDPAEARPALEAALGKLLDKLGGAALLRA
jgi:hypothetical protein